MGQHVPSLRQDHSPPPTCAATKHTHLHVAVLDLPGLLLRRGVVEGVVVAELEEALDPGRRVLRTLAVVAVRERHDETRTLQPLALAGGDELVNHDLGAVGKVAD
jgi:hypothetical protein